MILIAVCSGNSNHASPRSGQYPWLRAKRGEAQKMFLATCLAVEGLDTGAEGQKDSDMQFCPSSGEGYA